MSSKTKTDIQVPFDPFTERPQYYAQAQYRDYKPYAPIWKDNYEFEATLTFKEFRRGRSAFNAYFIDGDGMQYSMFLTDFTDCIPIMNRGRVAGRFTFCKRGANYGLRLVP